MNHVFLRQGSLIILLFTLSFLFSCKKAPSPLDSQDQFSQSGPSAVDRPHHTGLADYGAKLQKIWILFQESGETSLAQYHLKEKFWQHGLLPFGSDTKAIPDPRQQRLFLLQRMSRDAIYNYQPSTQRIVEEYAFPEGSNPQHAYRDPQGQVWVSLYETNELRILSPDLKTVVKNISLDFLKDESDPSAELSFIAPIDREERFVAVLAQRIQRGPLGRWIPAPQGAMAIIDRFHLRTVSAFLLPLSNPLTVHFSPSSNPYALTLVGSGDLSLQFQSGGKIVHLNDSFYQHLLQASASPSHVPTLTSLPEEMVEQEVSLSKQELILDALWLRDDQWFTLVWKPKKQKTCLQEGAKELFCEKDGSVGYVMGQMTLAGGSLYGDLNQNAEHFLWRYQIQEKTFSKMPVEKRFYSLVATE